MVVEATSAHLNLVPWPSHNSSPIQYTCVDPTQSLRKPILDSTISRKEQTFTDAFRRLEPQFSIIFQCKHILKRCQYSPSLGDYRQCDAIQDRLCSGSGFKPNRHPATRITSYGKRTGHGNVSPTSKIKNIEPNKHRFAIYYYIE